MRGEGIFFFYNCGHSTMIACVMALFSTVVQKRLDFEILKSFQSHTTMNTLVFNVRGECCLSVVRRAEGEVGVQRPRIYSRWTTWIRWGMGKYSRTWYGQRWAHIHVGITSILVFLLFREEWKRMSACFPGGGLFIGILNDMLRWLRHITPCKREII
jgi:hypothetical protein